MLFIERSGKFCRDVFEMILQDLIAQSSLKDYQKLIDYMSKFNSIKNINNQTMNPIYILIVILCNTLRRLFQYFNNNYLNNYLY